MENEFERLFGENARERLLNARISEFVTDDATKLVFDELCEVISSSNITNKEIIEKLMILPYNIAYSIILKSNKDVEDLLKIYHDKLYHEFLRDVRNVGRTGVSEFERRFKSQTTNAREKFLRKRLLTRYELELLFIMTSKRTEIKGLSYKEKHEYKGDDIFLRQLSCAHASLTEPKQSKARHNTLNKIKINLMLDVICQLKNLNKEV